MTLSIRYEGLFAKLLAWMTKDINERYLAMEANGLKARCEAEGSEGRCRPEAGPRPRSGPCPSAARAIAGRGRPVNSTADPDRPPRGFRGEMSA